MNVTFYSDFVKKINSTKIPSDAGTKLDVYLKADCSVLNPVFLIDGINLSYNYCYWSGRYYFITDITLNSNNIYEISCTVDVLASYKTDVGNYTAFVERSASDYDVMVNDNYLSSAQEIVSVDTAYTDIGLGLGCYIFSVFNINGIQWFATENLGALVSMFNNITYDSSFLGNFPMNVLLGALNFADWMGDVMWIPFNVDQVADISDRQSIMLFGYIEATLSVNFDCYPLTYDKKYASAQLLSLPTNYYSDFRKANDIYSGYTIYLPGVGTLGLSAIEASEGDLYLDYGVDFFSGSINYILKHGNASTSEYKIISQYNGQIGIPIPMGKSSGIDGGNLITTMIGAGISVATEGLGSVAVAKAGESMIGSMVSTAMSAINPNVSISGGAGNRVFLLIHNVVRISVENYQTKDFPQAVAGRPLFENTQISNLSGFVKCGNASVDIAGFESEKAELNGYLNTGFYYE